MVAIVDSGSPVLTRLMYTSWSSEILVASTRLDLACSTVKRTREDNGIVTHRQYHRIFTVKDILVLSLPRRDPSLTEARSKLVAFGQEEWSSLPPAFLDV